MSSHFDALSIDSTVAISCQPFEELGCFDEKKENKKDEVRDEGSDKNNSKNSGEEQQEKK